MYVPDNYDAFLSYDAEQAQAEEEINKNLPVCAVCCREIQGDEKIHKIDVDSICEGCYESVKASMENY